MVTHPGQILMENLYNPTLVSEVLKVEAETKETITVSI